MARRRSAPAEKKKIPIAAWLLGVVGAAAVVRAVWRPYRSIVKSGAAQDCAGPEQSGVCNATMVITSQAGSPVYSVGAGRVLSAGPTWTHIQVSNEPVILYYSIPTTRAEGSRIGRGQTLGRVPDDGLLAFGVWEQTDQGLVPLEPASWLASRGCSIAAKLTKKDQWCEQGRKLLVPKEVHTTCGLRLPEAAGFGLLPVSIQEE